MKKLILGIIFCFGVGIVFQPFSTVLAGEVDESPEVEQSPTVVKPCPDGSIVLNTDVPFVGRCITKSIVTTENEVTIANVFPKLT